MDAFLAIFRTPSKIQKFTDAENTPPPSPENWECFEQSCLNRTESVHGTLSFLFLSHLQCMGYVWISSLWIGTFQRAAPRPIILLTDNIQSGSSFSVSHYQCSMRVFPWREQRKLSKVNNKKRISEWRRLFTLHFRAHKHSS